MHKQKCTVQVIRFFFLALILLVGQSDYYLESWISETINGALGLHNIPAYNSKGKQKLQPHHVDVGQFIIDATMGFLFPTMVD